MIKIGRLPVKRQCISYFCSERWVSGLLRILVK